MRPHILYGLRPTFYGASSGSKLSAQVINNLQSSPVGGKEIGQNMEKWSKETPPISGKQRVQIQIRFCHLQVSCTKFNIYTKLCPLLYVTSSAKRDLIAEKTASSQISCFYTFAIVFFINTAQGARKMFPLDAHQRQISQALIRRRASCAASDQGL